MMTDNERLNEHAERIARLEGINEEIRGRLGDMNGHINDLSTRLNVQIAITFGVWATVAGVLLAVLFKN